MRLDVHLLALALVVIDLGARTVRIRGLMTAVHAPLSWLDALCLNAWADLASAITPLRMGGEPARLAALRTFRVPVRPALSGLALELAMATPVTVVVGAVLVAAFASSWSAVTLPAGGEVWLVGLGGAVGCLVVAMVWRWRRRLRHPLGTGGPAAAAPQTIALVIVTTLVSVMSRAAILPVLASHAAPPGTWGAMLLGSFLLTFGQALVPVPAGAGVVEAAYLGGAAGVTDLAILVAWRAYSVGFGVALGGLLMVWRGIGAVTAQPLRGLALRAVRYRGRVVPEQPIEDRSPASR